jgi:hypothetical protein
VELATSVGNEGLVTTARTLRRAFEIAPEAVEKILLEEYPWLDQIPKSGLSEFAAEFVRAGPPR